MNQAVEHYHIRVFTEQGQWNYCIPNHLHVSEVVGRHPGFYRLEANAIQHINNRCKKAIMVGWPKVADVTERRTA